MPKRYLITVKETQIDIDDPIFELSSPTLCFKLIRDDVTTGYPLICTDSDKIEAIGYYFKEVWDIDTLLRNKNKEDL